MTLFFMYILNPMKECVWTLDETNKVPDSVFKSSNNLYPINYLTNSCLFTGRWNVAFLIEYTLHNSGSFGFIELK